MSEVPQNYLMEDEDPCPRLHSSPLQAKKYDGSGGQEEGWNSLDPCREDLTFDGVGFNISCIETSATNEQGHLNSSVGHQKEVKQGCQEDSNDKGQDISVVNINVHLSEEIETKRLAFRINVTDSLQSELQENISKSGRLVYESSKISESREPEIHDRTVPVGDISASSSFKDKNTSHVLMSKNDVKAEEGTMEPGKEKKNVKVRGGKKKPEKKQAKVNTKRSKRGGKEDTKGKEEKNKNKKKKSRKTATALQTLAGRGFVRFNEDSGSKCFCNSKMCATHVKSSYECICGSCSSSCSCSSCCTSSCDSFSSD